MIYDYKFPSHLCDVILSASTVRELHLDHGEEHDGAAEGVGVRARRAHGGPHPVQGHRRARHPRVMQDVAG